MWTLVFQYIYCNGHFSSKWPITFTWFSLIAIIIYLFFLFIYFFFYFFFFLFYVYLFYLFILFTCIYNNSTAFLVSVDLMCICCRRGRSCTSWPRWSFSITWNTRCNVTTRATPMMSSGQFTLCSLVPCELLHLHPLLL